MFLPLVTPVIINPGMGLKKTMLLEAFSQMMLKVW
jgi:hypothetical protein